MTPLAPGRLSTITGWRKAAVSLSAYSRAAASVSPPAGQPTTSVIGRLGQDWVGERFAGERAPRLRAVVPRERVRIAWAGSPDRAALDSALDAFRRDLAALPDAAHRTVVAPKRDPSRMAASA